MIITFNKAANDFFKGEFSPPYNVAPYTKAKYWSRVLPELKKPGEDYKDFLQRLEDEWKLRILSGPNFLGLTGVDIDEASLTALLIKYPP
jgi:hypothetical protein